MFSSVKQELKSDRKNPIVEPRAGKMTYVVRATAIFSNAPEVPKSGNILYITATAGFRTKLFVKPA
jgi:hypothetical protein